MTRKRTHARRGGYSLIELTLVLSLLAIFSATANKLFMLSFSVKGDALRAGQEIAQTDGVVRLLRSDAWSASAIQVGDRGRVMLEMPDGSIVRWELHAETFDEKTTSWLTRTEVNEGLETPGDPLFAPPGIGFEADGTDLYLTTGSDSVRLPTALSLFGEVVR